MRGPVPGIVAGALLLLAGCANIHNDRTRTKVEGTSAGVATGGILGGVIGGIAGLGSPSSIAQGAIIGAQIGGNGGYAYASSVADRKAEYASREEWLNACIAEAKTTAEKSRAYSELARRIIARQQREIAEVLKNGEVRPGSVARAAAIREELDTDITNLSGAIQTWDRVLEAHREVVRRNQGNAQAEALNEQADQLNQWQDDLRQDLESFHALRRNLGP